MRFAQAKIFHSLGLGVKILILKEKAPDFDPGLFFHYFYYSEWKKLACHVQTANFKRVIRFWGLTSGFAGVF
jgi:hypothetical protein